MLFINMKSWKKTRIFHTRGVVPRQHGDAPAVLPGELGNIREDLHGPGPSCPLASVLLWNWVSPEVGGVVRLCGGPRDVFCHHPPGAQLEPALALCHNTHFLIWIAFAFTVWSYYNYHGFYVILLTTVYIPLFSKSSQSSLYVKSNCSLLV